MLIHRPIIFKTSYHDGTVPRVFIRETNQAVFIHGKVFSMFLYIVGCTATSVSRGVSGTK